MLALTVRCARRAWLGTVVVLAALLTSLPAFGSVVLEQVASGIVSPTDIQNARDGSGRLFFVQQFGQIMVWKNGVVLPTAFLDISNLIVAAGEQGLLGLAFHPDYRNNGYFYVNYSRSLDGATVVARYSRSPTNPDVADPQSATVLLTIAQPFANHNGGAVRFGPDGYLYIGMGDGGSGNDPQNNAQNLTSLLGKMLRIDVNTTTGPLPYGIPPDNPFVGSPGVLPEIWAYGLRNPWRFSFDRVAGDLFIGDVGQSAREEIDFVRAGTAGGMNFGWRVMEGTLCTNLPGDPPCNPSSFTPPIVQYDHSQGCSVTGGYLYRGHAVPELIPAGPPAAGQLFNGIYVYGDLCSGTIWGISATAAGAVSNSALLASGLVITTFGEDENGEIYVAHINGAKIYRLVSTVPLALIDHYYQEILGRAGDAGGVAFWQSEVARLSGLGADPTEAFIAMAVAFYTSPEFAARGLSDTAFVDSLYNAFLNRAADAEGRSYWVAQINQGLSREMVLYGFLFSGEFAGFMAQNLGSAPSRAELYAVIDFYRGAFGRLPDSAGFKFWVNQFRSAQCSSNPTGPVYDAVIAIASGFFESGEYWSPPAKTNNNHINNFYNAFMRRGADVEGYLFWVNQLAGGADFNTVRKNGFIDSPEFALRVQQIVNAGCTTLMQ